MFFYIKLCNVMAVFISTFYLADGKPLDNIVALEQMVY